MPTERQRFLKLLEVYKLLNSELDLDKLLDVIMDTALEITDAKRGFLILLKDGEMQFKVTRNIDKGAIEKPEFEISHSIARDVLRSGKPIITIDAKHDEAVKKYSSVTELGLSSILCMPFKVKGRVVGVFYLDNPNRVGAFSDEDIPWLSHFSDQAAIAIENARLYSESIRDRLTDLYAHNYFLMRLEEEVKRCARFKRKLSILLLDIDLFKNVNDSLGHEAGNKVLRRVSEIIKGEIRGMDILAKAPESAVLGRFGGDEFEIIMPETPADGALAAAERIRAKVAGESFVLPTPSALSAVDARRTGIGQPRHITISIGIATYPDDAEDPESLFHAADEALYQAKRAGRDTVRTPK